MTLKDAQKQQCDALDRFSDAVQKAAKHKES